VKKLLSPGSCRSYSETNAVFSFDELQRVKKLLSPGSCRSFLETNAEFSFDELQRVKKLLSPGSCRSFLETNTVFSFDIGTDNSLGKRATSSMHRFELCSRSESNILSMSFCFKTSDSKHAGVFISSGPDRGLQPLAGL
jgi:hypothetical protein